MIENSGGRQVQESDGSVEVCVVLENPLAGDTATVSFYILPIGDNIAMGMKN